MDKYASQKRYYQNNKKKLMDYQTLYNKEHIEEINKKRKERYYKNVDKERETARIGMRKYRENILANK